MKALAGLPTVRLEKSACQMVSGTPGEHRMMISITRLASSSVTKDFS